MASKKKSTKKKTSYNPLAYVKIKNPGTYTSAYTPQIKSARKDMDAARAGLMNFKYDPLQDANYQAYASIYGARGNQAAQDTLGDAAMLNGGYGSSYAVSAAQQARNQYNQELAALIPELEANAYQRMASNYGLLQDNYNMLMDADNLAYQRYRDAMADYQWGRGYDTDLYQYKQQQKKSGGGGGGRRSGGGGGGYGSYSGDSSSLLDQAIAEAQSKLKDKSSSPSANYVAKPSTLNAQRTATPQINKKIRMTR